MYIYIYIYLHYIYEEIRITEKDQVELVKKCNNLLSKLRRKNVITENENNYFRFNFKKATNLGKLYLLPKVPGRPVISSGTPLLKKFNETRRVLYKRQGRFFSKT